MVDEFLAGNQLSDSKYGSQDSAEHHASDSMTKRNAPTAISQLDSDDGILNKSQQVGVGDAIAHLPASLVSEGHSSPVENDGQPTGLEPELGGYLRDNANRTGLEPELGGVIRQNGVYVDEVSCIGCTHCSQVARNTFYIESDYGRARVFQQDGDSETTIQEAIDTCPVDCIHWVDYTELKQLESRRKYQVIKPLGFIQEYSTSPLMNGD